MDRGGQELRWIQEFDVGHLQTGVNNTLCKYILLPRLETFTDRYPHMKVTMENQTTARILSRLEQQKVGLGLVAEPLVRRDLVFIPATDIQSAFIIAPNYPENLYPRKGWDTSLFETGNIMFLDINNMTRHYMDEYMAENNICPCQVLEVTTMNLLIEFAKIGLGIACVVRELVQKELNSGPLVETPLYISIHRRTIDFAYRPSNWAMTLKTFLEFLY